MALYSGMLCKSLPYKEFQWVSDPENFNVLEIFDSDVGHVLEVDIDIPENLHDKFADFPLLTDQEIPPGKKDKKLLATLYNKKNYTIHIDNLKYAMSQGYELKKIHRVLRFKQKAFLKDYIELNMSLRSRATNDFEKNFYKLMCNSIFGRSIMNKRNFVDFQIVKKWSLAKKRIARPNFSRSVIFSEDCVGFLMKKPRSFSIILYTSFFAFWI